MGMTSSGRLLSIGEFSRLSAISVRMLRHYDAHGVLHPTRTDPRSGYRSYAADLLPVAGRIRRLRDLGLGVAELAEVVAVLDDAVATRRILDRLRTRLIAEATAAAARIQEVDRFITTLQEPTMTIEVTHRTQPARTVASLRDTIPTYADEGRLWQRLMPALSAAGTRPDRGACAIAVFHDEDYRESDCDVEIQLAVTAPFPDTGDVRCLEVPAQEVAVGVLHGSYDGTGEVMAAVGRWVTEHGYAFAGPMFNVYLVSPQDDPDPAAWVTEICVPVAAT